LLKNPGFTAVAVLTLALGIGATTSIFSAVQAILLRPLQFPDAARLVHLWAVRPDFPGFRFGVAPEDYSMIETNHLVFEAMGRYQIERILATGSGHPEELSGAAVSASLAAVLRLEPGIGRSFIEAEETPGQNGVVVLSHAYWMRRFGGDPDALGKSVRLNDRLHEVVGILPPRVDFPSRTDVWVPLLRSNTGSARAVARLRAGVDPAQAQMQLSLMGANLKERRDDAVDFRMETLQEGVVGDVRPALLVLLGAVILLLLIVCANVGGLMLLRTLRREKEIGIRLALGAGRASVMRTLIAEGVCLVFVGGISSVLVARWGIAALRTWAPPETPRLDELQFQPGLILTGLAITAVAAILVSLFPILRFTWADARPGFLEHTNASTTTVRRARLSQVLVIGQVALVLVLVVGTALMGQSLMRLMQVDSGMRTDRLLVMSVHLPPDRYAQPGQRSRFLQQVVDRLKTLPGVERASAASGSVLNGRSDVAALEIEGVPGKSGHQPEIVNIRHVETDFFTTLGIRLRSGRDFNAADEQRPMAAVINRAMERRYWSRGDALGKRLSLKQGSDGRPVWLEIVGIAEDARTIALNVPPAPEVFVPLSGIDYSSASFFLRTANDPESLAGAARDQVWSIAPDQPVSSTTTMSLVARSQFAEPRFRTFLLGAFAALGLLLSLLGVYGVVAYSVSQRTREIGLRMALGASRGSIRGLIVGQGLRLALYGTAIGVAVALALTRTIQRLLFGIHAADPASYLGVAAVVVLVTVAASYIPARRAGRIDPMKALRSE